MSPCTSGFTRKTTIKDQGQRGTCLACAATSGHELIRSDNTELSIEFLNWAAKQWDGMPPDEDGTTIAAAKTAIEVNGQSSEQEWPYDGDLVLGQGTYAPTESAINDAQSRTLRDSVLILPTARAIRQCVDSGSPVVVGLQLHSTWMEVGFDGLIADPLPESHSLGGHAVLVVGYDAGHFVIQNSWGISWGCNGLGFLTDDYIDRYCSGAWCLVR